jgi:hypothetical protein
MYIFLINSIGKTEEWKTCTRLSSLKSEILCELHYNNKVVVGYFPRRFPRSEFH